MTQTLTVEEIKENARKYYQLKKLTAQHPNPKFRRCTYKTNDDYCCSIGASLTQKTLKEIDEAHFNEINISRLRDTKIINFNTEAEFNEIWDIQQAHDHWANRAQLDKDSKLEEETFCNIIGLEAEAI